VCVCVCACTSELKEWRRISIKSVTDNIPYSHLDISVVLKWCYSSVTKMSQCCHIYATSMSHLCVKDFDEVRH
jgi:hypothetical protein